MTGQVRPIGLEQLVPCFEGSVPAVIATASADGLPNVTYLSKVHRVDEERVALSNQFFSKTARNLAENPRASLLLIDPVTYDEYRLTLVYERTERQGPVFDRLRRDVDTLAALTGMQDVFHLRAADIYRVTSVVQIAGDVAADSPPIGPAAGTASVAALGELAARLGRCPDLDTLVSCAVRGLDELLGYHHSLLLLLDEEGSTLYTIASQGHEGEGVGSEVPLGEGIIGMAGARGTPIRVGNLRQMAKYAESVRRSYEDLGEIGPGRSLPVPGLPDAESRVAVPAMAMGELVGVLVVDERTARAFDETDESVLRAVATMVAGAVETVRARERAEATTTAPPTASLGGAAPGAPVTQVRFFSVDGSTFLDGEYLIKGVAGRILWSLLRHHRDEGRIDFTNREVRLDPTLELPEYRDNLESRLILLKRRLEEHQAPIRLEKTGRGRFRLVVTTALRLEETTPTP